MISCCEENAIQMTVLGQNGANNITGLVAYVRLDFPNERLRIAQDLLEQSIRAQGLQPFPLCGGKKLNVLGDILARARASCSGNAFVWCNSDVFLTRSPFDVPDASKVYGFHRREVPSGEIGHGVDMYYIPAEWWDRYLSKDVPELHVGASYVDWWISRAMQKQGAYENLVGYIDHPSHPQSGAAADDANPYYQKNFRGFNAWARRNGLAAIPAPPLLIPRLGHVWGIRHASRRLAAKWFPSLAR